MDVNGNDPLTPSARASVDGNQNSSSNPNGRDSMDGNGNKPLNPNAPIFKPSIFTPSYEHGPSTLYSGYYYDDYSYMDYFENGYNFYTSTEFAYADNSGRGLSVPLPTSRYENGVLYSETGWMDHESRSTSQNPNPRMESIPWDYELQNPLRNVEFENGVTRYAHAAASSLPSPPESYSHTPSSTSNSERRTQSPTSYSERRKELVFNEEEARSGHPSARSTIMLKKIPLELSRNDILRILDEHCLMQNLKLEDEKDEDEPESAYDFVYLPMDYIKNRNFGYGFVNFTNSKGAWRFYKERNGKEWLETLNSVKVCKINYAIIQGKEKLMQHFIKCPAKLTNEIYHPVTFDPPRNGVCDSQPLSIFTLQEGQN